MSPASQGFGKNYSQRGFFRKLLGDALGWRREAAERALKSFYALHFCTTPVWSWTVS